MNDFFIILFGYIADLKLGDPHFKYHPVIIFGKIIDFLENILNFGKYRKIKGVICFLICVFISYYSVYIITDFTKKIIIFHILIGSVLFYFAIANKQLIIEAKSILDSLQNHSIDEARKKLSMIVGRDVDSLDEQKIKKAVIETMSENLSDGVVAPLFYFLIGGLPLMYLYKMVNTLDSMIGYKNEKYVDFGYFSAKADDIFNFIPSRLTGLLISLVNFNFNGIKFMKKYAKLHLSPNAGYPESSIAGILDCKLGGNAIYGGKIFEKAVLGENNRIITDEMMEQVIYTNQKVSFICIIFIFFGKIS